MSDEYGLAIIYLVVLFIVVRIFGIVWTSNLFKPRRPKRDHLFVKPQPNHIKIPQNSHISVVFNEYMRAGCTVALDASYIMSYYDDIFSQLGTLNPDSNSKIIISKESIDRIEGLMNTKHAMIAQHVLKLIENCRVNYPNYIEITSMDAQQYKTMNINPEIADEREIASYKLYNQYHLTNVVLFTVNEEPKHIGKKFGLSVYPIHKWA